MIISAAGRDVEVSSPDKVFFADRGETKLDLVDYYLAMAEPVMRQMRHRPVMMQRFPNGAGGSSFFQKRIPDNAPDWLHSTAVHTMYGTESRALVIGDIADLVWAVNLGCLGFHVWAFQVGNEHVCDQLRIDLDPDLVIRPDLSIRAGAILPWATSMERGEGWTFRIIEAMAQATVASPERRPARRAA